MRKSIGRRLQAAGYGYMRTADGYG